MNVLTITTLFPNPQAPRLGIFVKNRLAEYCQDQGVRSHVVIAPVPYFPRFLAGFALFARYRKFLGVPEYEEDGVFKVFHPRYLQIPKIGSLLAPIFMYLAIRKCFRNADIHTPDIVDSHFIFPDAVAGTLLARHTGAHSVITARGSDVNYILHEAIAGWWSRWALQRASAVTAVSRRLARQLQRYSQTDVRCIYNGVNTSVFYPQEAAALPGDTNATQQRICVCVGNLLPVKNQQLAIEALAQAPEWHLYIVGDGPTEPRLRAQASELDVAQRVHFVGSLEQTELAQYYNAADATLLCSHNEGLPNVLVESLACGTPVITTPVGSVDEIVGDATHSVILDDFEAEKLAQVLRAFPHKTTNIVDECQQLTRKFRWQQTSKDIHDVFTSLEQLTGESI